MAGRGVNLPPCRGPNLLAMDTSVARFWQSVRIGAQTECWEWTGSRETGGYGHFRVAGKLARTHRFSWQLHFGPIPKGSLVCHHCDNPPCVRPDHLFLGTDLDNNHDMIRKGRQRKAIGDANGMRKRPSIFAGERHPRAKLSDAQAAEIRRRYASGGHTQRSLAIAHGVSPAQVGHIIRGARRPAA